MKARGLAILLSLNVEAVTILLVAWFVGKKLNLFYPIKYSWINILFILSLIFIGLSWYMVLYSYKKMADKLEEKND